MNAWILVVFFICAGYPLEVFAGTFNGVNVPTRHWSYEAIERFAVWGLTDMSHLSKMPLSRMQMARKIASIIKRTQDENLDYLSKDPAVIDIMETLLERLIEEFRPELVELGVGLGDGDEEGQDSRFFRFSTGLELQKAFTNLDTTENIPENQQGWHLKDGLNLRGALDFRLNVKDLVGFEFATGVRKSEYDADGTLERGYLQFSLFNTNFQVGRESFWWGPGYHGSLLLSDNAFPFDSFRLTNDKPINLPWFFKKIGPLDVEYFITRLEEKRPVARPYFLGFRIELNPLSWLNLGFSRTIIFGGKAAPEPSISDYLQVFIPEHENKLGILDNDQKISVDFRMRLPFTWRVLSFFAAGAEIYGELAGEDDTTDITQLQPGHAINGGVFIPNLFNNKGLDARVEFSQNDEVWYIHHVHGAYKYRDSLIGHHMGGDADDVFVRLSKQLDEWLFGLQFSRERSGRSLIYAQTKNELRIDITLFHTADTIVSFAYEFEALDNLQNVSGKTAKNSLILFEAAKKF